MKKTELLDKLFNMTELIKDNISNSIDSSNETINEMVENNKEHLLEVALNFMLSNEDFILDARDAAIEEVFPDLEESF